MNNLGLLRSIYVWIPSPIWISKAEHFAQEHSVHAVGNTCMQFFDHAIPCSYGVPVQPHWSFGHKWTFCFLLVFASLSVQNNRALNDYLLIRTEQCWPQMRFLKLHGVQIRWHSCREFCPSGIKPSKHWIWNPVENPTGDHGNSERPYF